MALMNMKDQEAALLDAYLNADKGQETAEALMTKTSSSQENFITRFYDALLSKSTNITKEELPPVSTQPAIQVDPAEIEEFMQVYNNAVMQRMYDNDMGGLGSDAPDSLGNMGVPSATLKDVTDTEDGALSNPDPLYDMAEEVRTPTITTTALDDEGKPEIDFSKITNIQDVRSDSALDEEVVDVSPSAEAADQVAPTETVEAVEPAQNVKFKFKLGSTQGKRERAVYDYAKDQGLSGTELNAFMAQVGHESQKFNRLREAGYSTAKTIMLCHKHGKID